MLPELLREFQRGIDAQLVDEDDYVSDYYPPKVESHDKAKRLARLIVSEIGLYNPSWSPERQVEDHAREDLRQDIDQGREYYNERVSPDVRNSTDYYQDAVDWLLGHGDPSALDRVLEGSQRAGRSSFFTDIVARLKKPWSEKTAEELAAEVDAFIGSGCIREALQAVERALKTYPDDPKLRTKQCIAQAHSLREAPI